MRNAFPILVGLSLVIAAGFAAASAQDAGPDLDLAEIRARAAEHAAAAEALEAADLAEGAAEVEGDVEGGVKAEASTDDEDGA